MADTSVFKMPYPEAGDHTRLWEHYQALAEQIEKMAVGQYQSATGDAVNTLTTTTPVVLCSVTVYGRAGIPIRAVGHAWAQYGASSNIPRYGVGFSGGGLSLAANSSPNQYNQASGSGTVYAAASRERVAVPTSDGDVTITLEGWGNATGTCAVNYPALFAETRAWAQ